MSTSQRSSRANIKASFNFGDPEPEDYSTARKKRKNNQLGINLTAKKKKKSPLKNRALTPSPEGVKEELKETGTAIKQD